jgi:integrase
VRVYAGIDAVSKQRLYLTEVIPPGPGAADAAEKTRCRPLAAGSLRKIQAILIGAGKRAVRWGWVGRNPFEQAEPIAAAKPDPQPPTAEQAAAIVTEAWADPDWGMLVWLAMTTGARRGELCALRWDRVDFRTGMLSIKTNVRQRGARMWEKDTKTHQQRRIILDAQTLALLDAYRHHCAARADLDDLPGDARIFSPMPDGATWLRPSPDPAACKASYCRRSVG